MTENKENVSKDPEMIKDSSVTLKVVKHDVEVIKEQITSLAARVTALEAKIANL